jgi:hypothetical protein
MKLSPYSVHSQSDSLLLDPLMKWHSLINTTIPFFPIPYNRGYHLSRFPFHFIEPVTYLICTFIAQRPINQDEEVPV